MVPLDRERLAWNGDVDTCKFSKTLGPGRVLPRSREPCLNTSTKVFAQIGYLELERVVHSIVMNRHVDRRDHEMKSFEGKAPVDP